ncbi:hypothetical protein RKD19_003094 [Streptomyces canus]
MRLLLLFVGCANCGSGGFLLERLPRAPEGTPGLWVEKLSHYGANERELLLGNGNKYTITEAFEDANGQ